MSAAQPRVLVIGVSGFVGPWVAREFEAAGYAVIGADLRPSPALPVSVAFRPLDLLDAGAVRGLLEACAPDAVVNLAGFSSVGLSWQQPRAAFAVNVDGALNLLEAVRQCPRRPRLLLVGSSEEYAPADRALTEADPLDAQSPYGLSKLTQERLAGIWREHYGVETLCVRAFNHTGPGQTDRFVLPSFARQAARIARGLQEPVIRVGNIGVRRDFSHVEDVARAYRLIAEMGDPRKVYNVGSGRAESLSRHLQTLIGFTGREIRVEVDPARVRKEDNPLILCDNTRLREELGWTPRKTVEDALRELYEGFLREEEASAP